MQTMLRKDAITLIATLHSNKYLFGVSRVQQERNIK